MEKIISYKVPIMHIVIELNDVGMDAAGYRQEFRESFNVSSKTRHKQNDEWLKHVNNIATSIWNNMQYKKFNIIKEWVSKKSYTYYFRFQPTDKQGNLWDQELQLQLELRDHVSHTHDEGEVAEKLVVKTYYLNEKSYRDLMSMLRDIWKILDDLQDGDFSSFVE